MFRGIRKGIFKHDKERQDFLKRFAELAPESQMQCYARVDNSQFGVGYAVKGGAQIT
jgi:hypothetical protein